ncbi:hypothetical protein C7E12_05570, partial [Stenotrophomonas maltophilia]
IHWHGILLPANMDGVPGLSFNGIGPGETYHYHLDRCRHPSCAGAKARPWTCSCATRWTATRPRSIGTASCCRPTWTACPA